MNCSLSTKKKAQKVALSSILLASICCCNLLTGLVPQLYLSIVIVMLMALLATTGELYLAYPIMIFYYEKMGMVFGVSVYRLYSLLFILMTCIKKRKWLKTQTIYVVIFLVYALYCAIVVSAYNMRLAFFDVVDVLCALMLTKSIRSDESALKRFFTVYVAIALCSYITGIITDNSIGVQDVFGSKFTEYSRFQATFEDPNYMGFFFTIAIFAVITLELFSKRMRIVVVSTLYAMLLTAISVTSIIVNILLWCVYLYIRKQVNFKTVAIIGVVIIVALASYQYGINHRSSVIGVLSSRIEQKLGEVSEGDINEATTSRLELSNAHLQFYKQQSLLKQLFGGNLVTSSVIELGDISYSAHNEFIDELLNVGIVGECVLMGYAIWRSFELFQKYRSKQKRPDLCMFMCKITWFIYITSLTVFMDFKFMFPYFL